MKVLVTGHHGYIGSVMTEVLTQAGHEVTGLDTYLYEGSDFGPDAPSVPSIRKDIRDVEASDLRGFDAVVHLAALSNDPLGCLDESCTYDINHPAVSAWPARPRPRACRVSSSPRPAVCMAPPAAMRCWMNTRRSTRSRPTARPKCSSRRDVAELADDSFSPRSCATPPPMAPRPGFAPTSS